MADLRIKVSEDKVRETISILTDKIGNMNEHLSQLIENREKLERLYTGKTASIAISAIKKREAEASESIEKYKKQRDKLQEYLDLMNTADSKAEADYQAELQKSNELFS